MAFVYAILAFLTVVALPQYLVKLYLDRQANWWERKAANKLPEDWKHEVK